MHVVDAPGAKVVVGQAIADTVPVPLNAVSVRDACTLTAQQNRAREVIEGQKAARTLCFVKTSSVKPSLDQPSLTRARQLAGLKVYVTNIPLTVMADTTVIAPSIHAGQRIILEAINHKKFTH
ncbi:hypothetical protein J2S90_001587 [Arthrobacter bambusae]|uniref:Uncharacterized protein n=1 Tax=Arthrobacter bambusae TaxID=1338426 RepID=A0AAW8DFG0_9MICC|nr:hypothetical protein [Arthrobacter bambusae]MDP9904632.1 hypothetical protein [Arthrobacter bambusae]MDQ0129448.1 hypothetical protein [Arthrobacter bambusae]MDQ0180939.1 hypothetical protein [Arthrobacter bambusae]